MQQNNEGTDFGIEEGLDDEEEGESTTEKIKKMEKEFSSSKRKFKKLALNLSIVILKFGFLLLIMEGYFFMIYLFSYTFLEKVISITTELDLLVSRYPIDSLILTGEA